MLDFKSFKSSLNENRPPAELSELLQSLWWDAKNDWEKAHNLAQDVHNSDGSWIHAYLHRKEGDEGNASYWYSRAGRPKCRESLGYEWEEIARELLSRPKS